MTLCNTIIFLDEFIKYYESDKRSFPADISMLKDARDYLLDYKDLIKEKVKEAGDKAKEVADNVSEKAKEVADTVADKAKEMAEDVKDAVKRGGGDAPETPEPPQE